MDPKNPFLLPHGDPFQRPYKTPEILQPPGGKVAVFIPHPDDEVFGCGGTLIRHSQQGDRVVGIFLSHGGKGDPEGVFEKEDYQAIRKKEAHEAAKILGIEELVFFDYPDQYPGIPMPAIENFVQVFLNLLAEHKPATVYFPWLGETNADHWAPSLSIAKALPKVPKGIRLFAYEIWAPFIPDFIVDITSVYPLKEEAAKQYASQLRYRDYLWTMRGLDAYRSLFLTGGGSYGEAFKRIGPHSKGGRKG